MKSAKVLVGICLALMVTSWVFAEETKSKDNPLTGTWNCTAHLSGQDDIPFTMYLEQKGETVTGSLATGDGELEIKTGTYKDGTLEIHLETEDAKYQVTGKLEGEQFKGQWSKDPDGLSGDWEGKKAAPEKQ